MFFLLVCIQYRRYDRVTK